MAFMKQRRAGEVLVPQLVEVYGQFSPQGTSAPTVPSGTNLAPTDVYNLGVVSIVRSNVGLYTVTLAQQGEKLVNCGAWLQQQALASGAASAQILSLPSVSGGVITFTIQISVQTTITGQGASTAVDVAAGNGTVFFYLAWSDADYKA